MKRVSIINAYNMFEGFTEFDINVQSSPDVTIHGVQGGSGPALLLVHGFPQTHHIWHRVVPHLVSQFTIIAVDIRGYGASTKLPQSEGHVNYAKSIMARDLKVVMEKLGHDKYYICAHDRGARVAHKLCVDFPTLVIKAIFLDISPTLLMYSKTDFEFAKSYFHWFFLIQKYPLAEAMISQNPKMFAELFMGVDTFAPECFAQYLSVLEHPEAVHAMCEDYRAAATIDMEEARQDIEAKRFIQNPLRVLWGADGTIEKCFNAVADWSEVSTATVDGEKIDCDHYIPEEAPGILVENIKGFFV